MRSERARATSRERDGYPPGVPCWVDTGQPDPEAPVGFHGDLFGWEFVEGMPAGSPSHYSVAQLRGRDVAAVGSQQEDAPSTPVWNTHGEVFGWEATTLNLVGDGDVTMWRVPGYAEVLEVIEPCLRRRQALAGAPEGFADAIAWMVPIRSDQFPEDVSPHWSVTFAVNDTDAIVDMAADLGGRVMLPPSDAAFVRSAVLSDPQRAVFR